MDDKLIADLLEENRVNFAKMYQTNKVRKSEINNLFVAIEGCADSVLKSGEDYLKSCALLFKVLFLVVKLTREKKDLMQDIKNNLDEIGRIRKNGANEKTN